MNALQMAMPFAAPAGGAVAPVRFEPRHRAMAANGSSGPALALRSKDALCRIDMPGAAGRVVQWDGVRAELLTMARGGFCEWEFRLRSLVIMTQLDGGTTGCEWTDGGDMHKIVGLPPQSVLVNPADRYLHLRRKMPGGARLLLLTVDLSDFERPLDDVAPAQLQFQQRVDLADPFLHRILQAVAEEIEMPGPGGRLYRRTLSLLLITQLVRSASNLARPPKPAYAKGGLPSWRLKRALEMLDGGIAEPPSLADLARHVGLHPTSFCRAFKQSTGVSPHRYLLERRVAHAKEMMADHTLTLTQIALDCGFSSSSQFSVIFRRVTGLSPSSYRRSL